jgi:hypothetical protein
MIDVWLIRDIMLYVRNHLFGSSEKVSQASRDRQVTLSLEVTAAAQAMIQDALALHLQDIEKTASSLNRKLLAEKYRLQMIHSSHHDLAKADRSWISQMESKSDWFEEGEEETFPAYLALPQLAKPAQVQATSSLNDLYQIEEPDAVAEFLDRRPFLSDLLMEAYNKIIEVFGKGTPVKLKLFHDPAYPGSSKLFAVISTSLSAEEAIKLEDKLDQTWWIQNLDRARCQFNITVEFV